MRLPKRKWGNLMFFAFISICNIIFRRFISYYITDINLL